MTRPVCALIAASFALVGCARSNSPMGDEGPPVDRGPTLAQCGEEGEVLYGWVLEESPARLSGCEEFLGSVDFADEPIEDLDVLASLVAIRGRLNIFRNSSLRRLDGTNRLERVGGLTVRLTELTEVDGFASLRLVTGDVFLANNRSLTSLDGLASLRRIDGDLHLRAMPNLRSLDGLASLETIGGDVILRLGLSPEDIERFVERVEIGGAVMLSP